MMNEVRDWGGGEVLTLDLAKSLIKSGVDVTLAVNKGAVLEERAKEISIPVISFPMRNEIDIFAVMYIAGLLQKEKFTHIHCHTMRDHVIGSLAAKYMGGIPVIRSQHIHFPEKLSFLAQLAYHRWTDKIICNSKFIEKNLESRGIDKNLLITIHNGIDFERLRPPTSDTPPAEIMNISNEETIIGCIGSLFENKGQYYLIKAMPAIVNKIPKCKLVIIGEGPHRECLEKTAREVGISQYVLFLGQRKDISQFLRYFDILVAPSIWEEPFGLVIIEAMSAGVPVAASHTGGIPEILSHGKNGLLFAPKDESAIAAAVLEILLNKELRKSLIQNAKTKVEENFSIENMTSKVTLQYQLLLDEINNRGGNKK